MRYSLSDYIMTVSVPDGMRQTLGVTTISFGGEGSYVDNISFNVNEPTWNTQGDATGSWVHSKTLNRTGLASLTLNMVSPQVTQLTRLFNIYYSSDVIAQGVTITVSDANSNVVVTAQDCFIQQIPDLTLQNSPSTRNWQFTCGKIVFA